MVLLLRRFLIAVTIAAAAVAALGNAATAERLRIQTLDGPDSIATRGLEQLADELRTASGGEIDMVVLPVHSAVGPTATLDMMGSGAIDGHYSSPAYFADKDAAFALLGDTLALYPDPEMRDDWYAGGGLDIARALYAENGAHLIGFVDWPEEWLVSLKPASILADLSGLDIRAPSGPVSDLLKRIGARPVALGGRDALDGLKHGSIDAADWATLAANLATGAHADAHFGIRANHSMPVTEVSISTQAWERLSPSSRRLLENRVAQFSRSQRTAFEAETSAARATARAQGVTLLEMSRASQAELRRQSLAVFEDRAKASKTAGKIAASHRAFLERRGLIEPAEPETLSPDPPVPTSPEPRVSAPEISAPTTSAPAKTDTGGAG